MTYDLKTNILIPDLLKIVVEYVDGDIDVGFDLDNLSWRLLSGNPSAEYILEKESNESDPRINWTMLADNNSVIAMKIIEKNIEALDIEDDDGNYGWDLISLNPSAMDIIEKNLDKIDMHWLSRNNSDRAMSIVEKKIKNIVDFSGLCRNHSIRAIRIIEKNIKEIDWEDISGNPFAIDIIEKNLDKVDWDRFSANTSEKAIRIIENNLDKVDWGTLSRNSSASHLIEKKVSEMSKESLETIKTRSCKKSISWGCICRYSTNIPFLEKNLDRISWFGLSRNTKAVHILEQNIDKIDWRGACCNHTFFKEYPTIKLKKLLNIY